LYNIPAGMNMDEIRELTARQLAALPVLEVTHPSREPIVPVDGVQNDSKTNRLRPDLQTVPSRAFAPTAKEQQTATRPSRNAIYRWIVLAGFIAVGLILWRSRRSHQ
jgi:hypothetical protein